MSNHARKRNWFRRRLGFAEQKRPSWPTEPSATIMHGICAICGKRGLIYKEMRFCVDRSPRCIRIEKKQLEGMLHGSDTKTE